MFLLEIGAASRFLEALMVSRIPPYGNRENHKPAGVGEGGRKYVQSQHVAYGMWLLLEKPEQVAQPQNRDWQII